jgi:hypothetical protein
MWDFQKQMLYLTFALNPEVDWTETAVQEAWHQYGILVGRFLDVETPLTLAELMALCQAYLVQHGSSKEERIRAYTLEYQLQKLFENSIVIVGEWQPFYIRQSGRIKSIKNMEGEL